MTCFVTAGLFSVLHMDFTLTTIAALLTLAGYSINDTVVVFDRIRENRRKYKRMSLADLINLSTNQMLTRTILTSAATAISIIPLLMFVPALFDFTAAILFGIVVGTFSSTYVAAALLLYLPAPAGGIDTPGELHKPDKRIGELGNSDRVALILSLSQHCAIRLFLQREPVALCRNRPDIAR